MFTRFNAVQGFAFGQSLLCCASVLMAFTPAMVLFAYALPNGGCIFGRYPFSIYRNGILRFLTFVVPLALFRCYPLLYLPDMERGIFYMLAPLASLLFLMPCLLTCRFGLSRYKPTRP